METETISLSNLSSANISEWIENTDAKYEGSKLRQQFCDRHGIKLKYDYDLPEEIREAGRPFELVISDYIKRKEFTNNKCRENMIVLLKSVRQELLDSGVEHIEFEYAGAGDNMDYAEANVTLNESDNEARKRFFSKWDSFLDSLSYHIAAYLYSGSYNNEGGGGSSQWNLKSNTFEYYSYYNELTQVEDEDGTGSMEI